MSGCMEGYNAIGKEVFNGLDHGNLLSEMENETRKVLALLDNSQSRIFYSSTNPNPIVTMRNGKFSAAPAMSIEGEKITAVGSMADVERVAGKLDAENRIDLKGQCIVPGFIEPHLHIILSAMLQGFLTNCDPLNPDIPHTDQGMFIDTINFIKTNMAKLDKDRWFLGYGYDPSRLPLGSNGQFQDLDFNVFDTYGLNTHPVFIINASGHLAYANLLAFQAAEVDPKGATGILREPAAYQPFISKGLPANWEKLPKLITGMKATVQDWKQMGFTTVFDAGVGQLSKKWDADVLFALSAFAGLRIAGAAADLDPKDAVKVVGSDAMPAGGATDLKIKTIKLWMDGSNQGFTGALQQEYNPQMLPSYFSEDPNGWARWQVPSTFPINPRPTCDITTEMQYWAALGYQLMIHVNGDCASQVVLEAFTKIPKSSIMHRLEHFTITTPEQVAMAKELNLAVSHTIGHVRYWGQAFQKYILPLPDLPDRASRIDPVKDDLDNGLVYSFNKQRLSRQPSRRNVVLGPEQRVGVEAALAGVTINPAKQILLDDQIGSLEVGKSADFVILSQDITSKSLDTTTLSNDWVQETWFKGVNRYSKS